MPRLEGRIVYTERAFAQDAEQAMRGDVVRGIIELITNSDDAYGQANGLIRIDIHRPAVRSEATVISVSDKAKGLSPQEMVNAFSVLGSQTSGFAHGAEDRGLLGRGAKDTACFGKTVFTAVKNGVLSTMALDRSGNWELEDRAAVDTDYARIQLPDGTNGLTAAMHALPDIVTIPAASRLLERLSKHVQLRKLTRSREVVLVDRKGTAAGRSEVVLWEEPASDELLDKVLAIPGYETSCRLQLFRLRQRSDGQVNDYSLHGIEIRGARATYMNTMFSQSGHGTGLIRGIVECPYLDKLIREFDQRESHTDKNPVRIVRRDRDGLVVEHPFFGALAQAVVTELRPILDELEPDTAAAGGSRLRTDLNRAARLLGELLQTDLDELEGDGVSTVGPTNESPVVVIPPVLRAQVGSTRTLTILIYRDAYKNGVIEAFTSNSKSAVTEPATAVLPHATLKEVLISRIRVRMVEEGASRVTVRLQDEPDQYGHCDIIIHKDDDGEEEPKGFEWKNKSMSVGLATTRSLQLRAPIAVAPLGLMRAVVQVEGSAVTVLTPEVELKLTTQGWLVGRCQIRGNAVDKDRRIQAVSGETQADGRIRVTLPSREIGPSFSFELKDIAEGASRGRVEVPETGYVVKVFARHDGLAKYLGPLTNGVFRDEGSPVARAVLAECIASIVADFVARRDSRRDPSAYDDIDMIIERRAYFVARYLPCLITTLASNA